MKYNADFLSKEKRKAFQDWLNACPIEVNQIMPNHEKLHIDVRFVELDEGEK